MFNWVLPKLFHFSIINESFLIIMWSTRAFLSILLPGVKMVRTARVIVVLRLFMLSKVASVKTEGRVLVC